MGNFLRWLRALAKRRAPASIARRLPATEPVELDIVLSEIHPDGLDGDPPEATDYDVRSLGDPIDAAALHKKARRAG